MSSFKVGDEVEPVVGIVAKDFQGIEYAHLLDSIWTCRVAPLPSGSLCTVEMVDPYTGSNLAIFDSSLLRVAQSTLKTSKTFTAAAGAHPLQPGNPLYAATTNPKAGIVPFRFAASPAVTSAKLKIGDRVMPHPPRGWITTPGGADYYYDPLTSSWIILAQPAPGLCEVEMCSYNTPSFIVLVPEDQLYDVMKPPPIPHATGAWTQFPFQPPVSGDWEVRIDGQLVPINDNGVYELSPLCSHAKVVDVGFSQSRFVCANCDAELPNHDPYGVNNA